MSDAQGEAALVVSATAESETVSGHPTVAEAYRKLRSAQKPSAAVPPYCRYVNRPVGRVFAAVAARWGLTPNVVSFISASFSFSAIAIIAFGPTSHLLAVLIALLLLVGYAFDSADGQLARLTKSGSAFGEWLDHMIDCAKISSLHLAVAWHVLNHDDLGSNLVAIPMLYALIAAVTFFGWILTDQLRRAAGFERAIHHVRQSSPLRMLAVAANDYGALCLVFLLLGWPRVFLGVYGAFLVWNTLLLGAAMVRWVRILKPMGADGRTS